MCRKDFLNVSILCGGTWDIQPDFTGPFFYRTDRFFSSERTARVVSVLQIQGKIYQEIRCDFEI